jgi:hypothetical protein
MAMTESPVASSEPAALLARMCGKGLSYAKIVRAQTGLKPS